MKQLTATTPHGTFTRKTASPYRFVAVITMKDGGNVRVVGRGSFGPNARTTKAMARWSTTAAGAVKNAESYPYIARDTFDVHGPFPVDGTQASEPAAPKAQRQAQQPVTKSMTAREAARAYQMEFARKVNAALKEN